jgi:hypothetical protein
MAVVDRVQQNQNHKNTNILRYIEHEIFLRNISSNSRSDIITTFYINTILYYYYLILSLMIKVIYDLVFFF